MTVPLDPSNPFASHAWSRSEPASEARFDPHAWCAQRNAMMQRRDIEWFVDGNNPRLRSTIAAVKREREEAIRREEESIRQHRAGLVERERMTRRADAA